MAKLTAGRLLLATRGGALFLDGDESEAGNHRLSFLSPKGTGFPGTLAAFELPIEVVDRERLLQRIRDLAAERMPRSASPGWFNHARPPEGTTTFSVRSMTSRAEDARGLAAQMLTTLAASTPIAVDFEGISIATQSFLHALLFQPVRVAWALGVPIHIVNAGPAVRSGLAYLERYALT